MMKSGTLCALVGAVMVNTSSAETFKSKEELLIKYAPRFEQTTKLLEDKGYDAAPIEAYFAFGNAEVNQKYISQGSFIHDKGKTYQTYGAFPVSYDELKRWGPNVGYHPKKEGLSVGAFNAKLKTDTDFNVKMAAIRLSGMTNGNAKDKGMTYIKNNFLANPSLTDEEEAYLISYIGNKGTTGLKSNYNRIKSGLYNFANKQRGPNTRDGIKLARKYTHKRS